MKSIFFVVVASLSILVSSELQAQKASSKRGLVNHPEMVPIPIPGDTSVFRYRPELKMERALELAEEYIVAEHINISHYYLFDVHLIQYGSQNELRWYFWWLNENGSMGDYVELTVTMSGVVDRLGSL